MNAIRGAFRQAKRYADGGSDEEEAPLHPPLFTQPTPPTGGHLGTFLEMVPPGAPGSTPSAGPRPSRPPPESEPAPQTPTDRAEIVKDFAGQLVKRYGDNHQEISERMLGLDPQYHNEILSALPPSVRNGVIDHRVNEAHRLLNPQQPTEPPRQPGASRSGYVSPYGIYGRPQMSDQEYEALKNPGQLSQNEGQVVSFPGPQVVPKQSHPFDYMSSDAWNSFNKFLKPKFGDVYNFAKKFFAGYDPAAIKAESGEMYGYGPGSLNLEGQLHHEGNHVAEFDASIIPGSKGAHLGYFEISPAYRGVAGPALLRNQIDAYQKMGLHYVDLMAAAPTYNPIFGGSYAWAKYGFVPNQKSWDTLRQSALEKLDSGKIAPVDPRAKVIATNILNTFGPRAIWPLSDMKSPTASGMPYGKAVLLGNGSWHGQLTFKDPGAMRRFDAYLSRPKKPTTTN